MYLFILPSHIKSFNVLFLVAAISILLQGVLTYEIVGDLSSLQDQYHNILTEIENKESSYDISIATLLGKLDTLQHSPSLHNSTLDWFTPPKNNPSHPPLRITIVVSSFEGLFLNSGIGTFYSSLADFLLQKGHSVTILYADTAASDSPAFTRWSSQVTRRGAKAVRLGAFPIHLRLSTLAQRSYQVYEYLKNHKNEFDVVHFPEWEGIGYYTVAAKDDGILFQEKVFIVGIHGPWRWVKAANNLSKLQTALDMETDYMERKSVEKSDIIWTPSSDILSFLKKEGWGFPQKEENIFMMPYLPGREISQLKLAQKDNEEEEELIENINELVFFGRLETRKGIEIFCDALDRLSVTRPEFAGTKITFLGRSANIGNQTASSYIDVRHANGRWPFKLNFISHKDRKAALEYLKSSPKLAVIPSLVDNTPYTVYECLFSSIPFIASNLPSIASIVAPSDREKALFEVSSISLANKIEEALDNGAHIIKSSLLLSQIEASWNGLYSFAHQNIQKQKEELKITNKNNDNKTPLVSVCITHFNRPQFLKMAIESIEKQNYANFEIVLVDDGSTSQAAKDYLAELQPYFSAKGWKLILSPNVFLGAARNLAVSHSRGDYIFFLDDDNIATSSLLSTYVKVAQFTNGDVITAGHDIFEGDAGIVQGENVIGRWIPLGASPVVGLFKNCFGDANFFVKKSVFSALKGFTEDRGVGQEDHEFLANSVLQGYKLFVIPEPLLGYRMHNQSEQMIYTTDSLKNALRAHRPYRNLMAESGMEINENGKIEITAKSLVPTSIPDSLKLLAYSRSLSKRDVSCNLTVTGVSPSSFSRNQKTNITFTTSIRDCEIGIIKIGDFLCNLVIAKVGTFMCTAKIPIPGNYPVTLLYSSETNFRDTQTRVIVNPAPEQNGATSAMFTLGLYREPGLFSEEEVFGLLSSAVGNKVAPSGFSMISDTVTLIKKNTKRDGADDVVDELHTMMILVTSLDPTAIAFFNSLSLILSKTPKVILPYRFFSISLQAACSKDGVCSCSLNYVGVGCTTPARCPNDCHSRGNCIDGANGKLCKCQPGWAGSDCSVSLCPNDCSDNGDCIMKLGGNGTCSCYVGWAGEACDVPNCPGNCNGNSCNNGICQCPNGVTTPDCSIEEVENTGSIKVTTGDNNDNRDRDIFIGILVMFIALLGIAGAAVYITRQRKLKQDQQDD